MFKKIVLGLGLTMALFANTASMSQVSAQEAIKLLKEGNERFVTGKIARPHTDFARLQEVSKGQHPFVTINSCSDSRVPPELLFDQGFGDLFVIRNAGNVSATDEIGTIEYGTEHLGTRLVVVLGHTNCGAVTAVAKGDHVHGNIPALVSSIVPAVKRIRDTNKGATYDKWLNSAIKENAFESIANILKKSETVRELVLNGKVKIVAALYDVESGKVEFLGEHPEQLKILATIEANKMLEKRSCQPRREESKKEDSKKIESQKSIIEKQKATH